MVQEQNIQNWLIEEGLLKEKIHDENANFHYIISYPENNIMDIIQPKGKNDVLLIGCATQVAQEHIDLMREKQNSIKIEFIWDIRFSLNNFLLDFELNIDNNELKQFVITDEIFSDGLTKNSLIKSIKKIFKAKIQCVWLIEKTFGEIESNQSNHNENSMFV